MTSTTLWKTYLIQRWNTIGAAWRFAIIAFLIIRLAYALWSWVILTVQPLAIQNIEMSEQPILTVFELPKSQAYTYLREVNGQILTFRTAGPNLVTDLQTGSLWDVSTGMAVQGYYKGFTLAPADTSPAEIFPYHYAKITSLKWLAIWQRFDANWYLSIAEHGYGKVKGDAHFPPLFPALIRLFTPVFGDAFLTGSFISHLSALYAIKLLYDLFSEWGGDNVAERTAVFFLVYPASFFFFSVYTDPLFLVAALLSLREMKRNSWVWAGFWGFCGILTRLQGAALLLPLAYLIWRERQFLRKASPWIGLALPVMGGLVYIYLRSKQISNQILPLVEADLHTRMVPPWEGYWYGVQYLLSNQYTFIDAFNLAIATLFVVLLVLGWRKVPIQYNLFTALNFIIILSRITETQPITGMSRFGLTLFPCFYILGLAGENPWIRRFILYTFIPLNLYLSAQFFSWGWVA